MGKISLELVNFTAEHGGYVDGDYFGTCLRHYDYAMPWNALQFANHDAVRRALAAAGSHFYDREALRFFNARTSDTTMRAGSFWIESKRFETDPRTYQVAYVTDYNGSLSVERMAEVGSLDEARRLARRLAELVTAYRAQ